MATILFRDNCKSRDIILGNPHALTSSQAPSHAAKWDVRMLCQHLDDFHDRFDNTETERQAVTRSMFKDDKRLNEARSLLSTSKQRIIRLDPKTEWSDAEYLEKQKELAATLAT